mmetsp:Transcript_9061/g.26907  ORF Transcript_9061/g.26907 Transcript_9061/m.26907 type:complete len:286 (+) Transcript_9061:227-1084(+)
MDMEQKNHPTTATETETETEVHNKTSRRIDPLPPSLFVQCPVRHSLPDPNTHSGGKSFYRTNNNNTNNNALAIPVGCTDPKPNNCIGTALGSWPKMPPPLAPGTVSCCARGGTSTIFVSVVVVMVVVVVVMVMVMGMVVVVVVVIVMVVVVVVVVMMVDHCRIRGARDRPGPPANSFRFGSKSSSAAPGREAVENRNRRPTIRGKKLNRRPESALRLLLLLLLLRVRLRLLAIPPIPLERNSVRPRLSPRGHRPTETQTRGVSTTTKTATRSACCCPLRFPRFPR